MSRRVRSRGGTNTAEDGDADQPPSRRGRRMTYDEACVMAVAYEQTTEFLAEVYGNPLLAQTMSVLIIGGPSGPRGPYLLADPLWTYSRVYPGDSSMAAGGTTTAVGAGRARGSASLRACSGLVPTGAAAEAPIFTYTDSTDVFGITSAGDLDDLDGSDVAASAPIPTSAHPFGGAPRASGDINAGEHYFELMDCWSTAGTIILCNEAPRAGEQPAREVVFCVPRVRWKVPNGRALSANVELMWGDWIHVHFVRWTGGEASEDTWIPTCTCCVEQAAMLLRARQLASAAQHPRTWLEHQKLTPCSHLLAVLRFASCVRLPELLGRNPVGPWPAVQLNKSQPSSFSTGRPMTAVKLPHDPQRKCGHCVSVCLPEDGTARRIVQRKHFLYHCYAPHPGGPRCVVSDCAHRRAAKPLLPMVQQGSMVADEDEPDGAESDDSEEEDDGAGDGLLSEWEKRLLSLYEGSGPVMIDGRPLQCSYKTLPLWHIGGADARPFAAAYRGRLAENRAWQARAVGQLGNTEAVPVVIRDCVEDVDAVQCPGVDCPGGGVWQDAATYRSFQVINMIRPDVPIAVHCRSVRCSACNLELPFDGRACGLFYPGEDILPGMLVTHDLLYHMLADFLWNEAPFYTTMRKFEGLGFHLSKKASRLMMFRFMALMRLRPKDFMQCPHGVQCRVIGDGLTLAVRRSQLPPPTPSSGARDRITDQVSLRHPIASSLRVSLAEYARRATVTVDIDLPALLPTKQHQSLSEALIAFVQFVHAHFVKQRDLADLGRTVLLQFIRDLSSPTSFQAVVPFRAASLLEQLVDGTALDVRLTAVESLRVCAPLLGSVADVLMWWDWQGMLSTESATFLKECARVTAEFYAEARREDQTNVGDTAFRERETRLTDLLVSGQKLIRPPTGRLGDEHMQQEEHSCNKYNPDHNQLAPGLFLLLCEHGTCLAFQTMEQKESARTMVDIIVQTYPQPPPTILYDTACQVLSFVLRRMPWLFRDTTILLDSFHAHGHVCASALQPRDHPAARGVNSQLCEQANRFYGRFRRSLPFMKHLHFNLCVLVFTALWNRVRGPAASGRTADM